LNRVVAIGTAGFNLAHRAGTQLNNRYRANAARGVNRLSHPHFFTNQSTQHFFHQSSMRYRFLLLALHELSLSLWVEAERMSYGLTLLHRFSTRLHGYDEFARPNLLLELDFDVHARR
jgi:hypothetical protein